MKKFHDTWVGLKTQPDLRDHRIIFPSFISKSSSVLARAKMNLHFEPKQENSQVIHELFLA